MFDHCHNVKLQQFCIYYQLPWSVIFPNSQIANVSNFHFDLEVE